MTRKSALTVVVIPSGEEQASRSFRVSPWRIAAGLLLVVALAVGGAVPLFDWMGAQARTEQDVVNRENLSLRRELFSVNGRLAEIDGVLDRVLAYDAAVRRLTRRDSGAQAYGIGPLEDLDEELWALEESQELTLDPALSADVAARLSEVTAALDMVQTKAEASEVSLQEIRGYLEDRHSVVRAYPSFQPSVGWLSSTFGPRRAPGSGRLKFHAGIDIAAPYGTHIRSSGDGVVSFAGWRSDYGRLIIIDHGYGLVSRYAHCSRMLVREGDRVERGELIGRIGATGRATGPHLHYEIHRHGVPVDPMRYMEETDLRRR